MLWLLWVIVVLSFLTAAQRFVKVWRQADRPPAPLPVEPAAVVLRWRAWREERAGRDATWWARAPRGPGSSASGGLSFLSGSRRPGSGAAGSRWHERRLARRDRFPDGTNADANVGSGAGAANGQERSQEQRRTEIHDEARARRRSEPKGQN
jgi:hypothetical protein